MEDNMGTYIEKRPEYIVAIKKSIGHWNDICLGCENKTSENECALCMLTGVGCSACPLGISGNICTDDDATYDDYVFARSLTPEPFCSVGSATEAEAMLEALVQLLPPEHRKDYGG
jgi:hypothetical protein